MELSTTALITVEETELILGTDPTQRDRVLWCINAISATASRIAGRIFSERVDEELYLEGNHDRSILLPDFPVSQISAVYMDPNRAFTEESLLLADSYDVDMDAGIIYLLDRDTPIGRKTIKVIATIGYTSLPEDLKQAALEGVSWMMDRLNDHAIGVASISSSEGINTSYERYLPPSIKDVFLGYRVMRL